MDSIRYKDIYIATLLLIVLVPIYSFLNLYKLDFASIYGEVNYKSWSCIHIPAVINSNSTGILTNFCISYSNGTGTVFTSIPPIYSYDFSLGFLFSKKALCNIHPEKCNKYDYYIRGFGVTYAEGLSGTAGFFLLMDSVVLHKHPITNYPITGFVLPNGVIGRVAGIAQKRNATIEGGYKYLVAPFKDKNKIIPVYTVLDIEELYFNKTHNTTIIVPPGYINAIKDATLEICSLIDNNKTIENLISNKRYYTAASLCFGNLVNSNISEDVRENITKLEKEINSIQCYTYECNEIKYQILYRLNVSKNSNGSISYARFLTAKGWMNFLKIANNIDRVDTCDKIKEEYMLLSNTYDLPDTKNCFEQREILAKLYYMLSGYSNNTYALNSILDLVKYYLNKNGFSITAYNYMQYSEDLARMGDNLSAMYYAFLALEYAI